MVEEDFVNEKKSAVREFEEQKVYLRDQVWIPASSGMSRSKNED